MIEVEGLGKRYRLGQIGAGSLREEIERFFKSKSSGSTQASSRDFWALRDVSFTVNEGEVLGVIGRNGAGKSTLLKLLSRITEPTEGRAVMRGRVASLLEVGTGFHPELSGRENIFLNGSILGMTKVEVKRKLDEIIDFAGVEKFLDTPVKRYSSGMRVRLGFAVAAHLEPEILIVDEVLAVGDVNFQNKCIGKMKEVSGSGRTVLFVSHNLSSIASLCNRGLLLEGGKMVAHSADVLEVLDQYRGLAGASPVNQAHFESEIFEWIKCKDTKGTETDLFVAGDDIILELKFKENAEISSSPTLMIGVSNENEERIFSVGTQFTVHDLYPLKSGATLICRIPKLNVAPGQYLAKIYIKDSRAGDGSVIWGMPLFRIKESDYFGNGNITSKHFGKVMQQSVWSKVE